MLTRYRLTLKEMPEDVRPRERLKQYGVGALSHTELLAILIGTGNRSETAIDIANRILQQAGGLKKLAGMTGEELSKFPGVGAAKSSQIIAAVELGNRIYKELALERKVIRSPIDVVDLVMEMQFLEKEHFRLINLSTKNHVIGIDEISIGSINSSIAQPREVFKRALERNAASIILAHNHPSGDPEPSKDDIAVTKRLVEAGKIIGVEVLDHIIIGDGKYRSLKELDVF